MRSSHSVLQAVRFRSARAARVLGLSESSSPALSAVRPTEKLPKETLGLTLRDKVATAVEYVSAVIASAGTPPSSLNRNPRYSNRVNRPSGCAIHRQFWDTILVNAGDLAVVTTNYDLLIERTLRHRPMRRPPSSGCFYGGLPRPQHLEGAAQPFSIWSPARLIAMTGTMPIGAPSGTRSARRADSAQDMPSRGLQAGRRRCSRARKEP